MTTQIGFILKTTKRYSTLVVPYHCSIFKYEKVQTKFKKYNIFNYRQEYSKGDIVLFDKKNNKIYKLYK